MADKNKNFADEVEQKHAQIFGKNVVFGTPVSVIGTILILKGVITDDENNDLLERYR